MYQHTELVNLQEIILQLRIGFKQTGQIYRRKMDIQTRNRFNANGKQLD